MQWRHITTPSLTGNQAEEEVKIASMERSESEMQGNHQVQELQNEAQAVVHYRVLAKKADQQR